MRRHCRAESSSTLATVITPRNRTAQLSETTYPQHTEDERPEQLEPEDYARRVSQHADQSSKTSLYPGQNYENLADFLWRPYGSRRPHTTTSDDATPPEGLESCVSIQSLGSKPRKTAHLDDVNRFLELPKEVSAMGHSGGPVENCLLFLRGYAAPQWLNAIGSKYRVDPEFFQRHLDFVSIIGKRNYFPLPSLSSSSSNIIRLRVTTTGYRDASTETTDQHRLEVLRGECSKDMDEYLKQIKLDRVEPGDSIVRRFSVHDNAHFSLEQDITICVNSSGRGWTIIAWLDNGKPLSEVLQITDPPLQAKRRWSPISASMHRSEAPDLGNLGSTKGDGKDGSRSKISTNAIAPGPWQRPAFSPMALAAELHPTIQHHPGMVLESPKFLLRNNQSLDHTRGFHQSACLLPLGYGKTLDEDATGSDAFYVLHELFVFKAFSEVQFLNVVEAVLTPETGHMVLQQQQPTLSNLLYHKELLLSHAEELRNNVNAIKFRGSDQWPRTSTDPGEQVAAASAQKLLHDFEILLRRTELLLDRCDQGMSIIMNNAMLAESKRAISQAKLVGRLTLLAYFYIPLSFTCSFFGMNFVQFNNGSELSLWIYFVTSVPILALSIMFLVIDIPSVIVRLLRLHHFSEWVRRTFG